MTTTELIQSSQAGAGHRLRIQVAAAFTRLVAMWRAARNRRSVARLLEWDEHMLRDIGVTPGDVRSALASPFSEDPSYRLGVMSLERRSAFRAAARERFDREVAERVRSKSETIAGSHRPARPHRWLEL